MTEMLGRCLPMLEVRKSQEGAITKPTGEEEDDCTMSQSSLETCSDRSCLQDTPGIKTVHARFVSGHKPGDSRLRSQAM